VAEGDEAVHCKAEAQLLGQLRAGEEAACRALVRQHTPRLLAVARRILGDEEDARDAVQDAFLQAFRALPRFEGGSRIGTWLYRIAVNAALMRRRSTRRRCEVPLDGLALPGADEPSPWCEERALALRAIGRLPARHRGAAALALVEGLSAQEMAPRLGVSAGAAKNRLHRARAALRRELRPDASSHRSVRARNQPRHAGGSMKTRTTVLAAAAGALFLAGAAAPAAADDAKDGEIKCEGVNSCKGHGACATLWNECGGKNECKGKGFVLMKLEECAAAQAELGAAEKR
jgi:RNA polymerase sigma-70 factor (ECF subfamily)